MKESIDRKYMLVLASLAVLVLIGGAFLRPRKALPQPPSPSETATLQARLQRDELAQTASYLAQRAQAVGQHVLYDPDHDSSAVVWEKPGQVLTTSGPAAGRLDPPLLMLSRDTGSPPPARPAAQSASRWLLIVGRTANGQPLWTPAIYGGIRQSTCSGGSYNELVVNARLDGALSGAGAFDLDGALHGIVAPCNGAFHLISVGSVSRLLESFNTVERQIRSTYGFAAGELSDDAKRLFAAESGLFVTEVARGEAADQAGLEAGDIIIGIGRRPVANLREVADSLASPEKDDRILDVMRNRRRLSVAMPSTVDAARARSADSTRGIRILPPAPDGEPIVVPPGTPAHRSGLRTGDRVVQVAGSRSRSRSALNQALSDRADHPVLVLYIRGTAQRAALVTK
jgi:hypothetical protein